ncbi:alpha/beta hydrolase [Aeromicrobium sp. PE09-221]|uniref:alpha/beta fold hydrolase n=1 Tax=Aeromicrobium sp. PE09-221 TaxID=1898043 RepID=UPI00191C8007|nr:alpha/beta hydrolase [Aeromicrobium sp. PE09-221]
MSDIPHWYSAALAQHPEVVSLEVEGTSIRYRAWGPKGAPVVVLVHGGAAHGGWWDHIGPHLAAEHRVLAIDLSGHGDSGRRKSYDLETWAREVVAVADAESDEPPVVYGHSMGGFVALTAARDHGERLRGAVAIDSPVHKISPESSARSDRRVDEKPRHYPDRETILGRFRTLPEDDVQLHYVVRHVAEGSVIEDSEGWRWKFDPRVFVNSMMEPEDLRGAACDVALLRGERGMATIDITETVRERLGGTVPVTVIPDAGHHIMLDQPVALIAALQTLLGQWRPTR